MVSTSTTKYGADLIKIYGTHKFHFTPDGKMFSQPTFTLDEVRAITNEAHREGVKVACHAYGGEGLHNCIDGGVDSIEHGLDLDDAAVRDMIAKGIWLVPTLMVYEGDTRKEDEAMSGGKVSRASLHEPSFRKALAAGVKITSFATCDKDPMSSRLTGPRFAASRRWITAIDCST